MVLCIHARVRVVECVGRATCRIRVLILPDDLGEVFVEAIDTVVLACHIDVTIRRNHRLIEVVACHRQGFYQYGPGLQVE